MRIIEGMGPPTQDTFGNSDYLYKDTETGAFYRCHGNINEDRTLPYFPAHKHPGEQYLWAHIPHAEVHERLLSATFVPNGPESSYNEDPGVAEAIIANPETVVIKKGDKEYPLNLDGVYEEGASDIVWPVHDPYGEYYGNSAGTLYVNKETGRVMAQYNAIGGYAVTLSVLEIVETVHKMDPKFLPEGYPYSAEETVDETRYFEPTGPDGGNINDLAFAKLIYGNLDKATYTYNGVDVVDPNFVTLQDEFAYIEFYNGSRKEGFTVQVRTGSDGNPTGVVWFGNDHFSNGSIAIKATNEVVHKMDPKFLPERAGDKFVARITEGDNGLVCDKTFEELEAAVETKTVVLEFFGAELSQIGHVFGRSISFAGVILDGFPVLYSAKITIRNTGEIEALSEGYDLSSLKMS